MKSALLTLTVSLLAFALPAWAGAPHGVNSFDGVWKITKYVRTGADPLTDTQPQPSLLVFSRGYYAIVRDNGHKPRHASPSPTNPDQPTDQEKIAKYDEWAPIAASAGTYEVKGHTLITHNLIAKQVKGVDLTEQADFDFGDPNTFIVRAKSDPGTPQSLTEITYSRVR